MLPGKFTDDRANAKRPRPPSGLIGWSTAWSRLERIEHAPQREHLTTLVRESGFQGAPALGYTAKLAIWMAGLSGHPGSAPANVPAAAIEARVRALVAAAPAGLFPNRR